MSTDRFDAGYYRRFYGRNPVHTAAAVGQLAGAVIGLAGWWGIRIRSVLDVGAGPGYWRDWFTEHQPGVRYVSTDASEYACERYGHERRDIARWTPTKPFDLVVCQSVLQYLTNTEATDAIEHLASATRHLLFFEVPTQYDHDHVVDSSGTDFECHWRTGEWYRRRLTPHFVQIGAGLWAHRNGAVPLYELERCAHARP
jgi:hypothetical protein